MIRHWMALAVLSLALAGQASAQTPANGAGRMPDDRQGAQDAGTGKDAGTMSPGTAGEGVDRSTDTTGVDRSTGAPSGLQDPSRRGTRTRPGMPGAENGTQTGPGDGTGSGKEEGTTKPPSPPTPMP